MKWIILALVAFSVAVLILSPTVMWDGSKQFTLTLSESSMQDTWSLFYRDQGNLEAGKRLCEFYRNEDIHDLDQLFRAVTISPAGKFTVEVPTFGTTRFWGLWQKRGMYEHVILMGKKKNGDRVFKWVPLETP